jgi:hypothetical protein
MRDLDVIDSGLRLIAALRQAARERGGPLPSTTYADELLDERREVASDTLERNDPDVSEAWGTVDA